MSHRNDTDLVASSYMAHEVAGPTAIGDLRSFPVLLANADGAYSLAWVVATLEAAKMRPYGARNGACAAAGFGREAKFMIRLLRRMLLW